MRSTTTITLYKDISEEECEALKTILNIPTVVEKMKSKHIQALHEIGTDCDEMTVEFGIEEL